MSRDKWYEAMNGACQRCVQSFRQFGTGWSSDLLLIVNLEICHAVFDACLTEDGNDPKVVDEGGSLLNAGFAASIQAPSLP